MPRGGATVQPRIIKKQTEEMPIGIRRRPFSTIINRTITHTRCVNVTKRRFPRRTPYTNALTTCAEWSHPGRQ